MDVSSDSIGWFKWFISKSNFCLDNLLRLAKKLAYKYKDVVNVRFNLLVSSGDDFFDDDFNNEFDQMDKTDKFHNKLEDGFKNWEER